MFEGPLVTEYAFTIAHGVRVKSVLSLREDLMRCLEYDSLNFEFPVLEQAKIGIIVPSDNRYVLPLRDVIESKWFRQTRRAAAFIIGKNRQNQTVMGDVADWPNMLIGGTTGSGKTSFVDSIILSMLYKYSPNELQFIMIDSTGTVMK